MLIPYFFVQTTIGNKKMNLGAKVSYIEYEFTYVLVR